MVLEFCMTSTGFCPLWKPHLDNSSKGAIPLEVSIDLWPTISDVLCQQL